MHQFIRPHKPRRTHISHNLRQIIPIAICTLVHPPERVFGAASLGFADVVPGIAPVIDRVADMTGNEIRVVKGGFAIGWIGESEEVVSCGVPAGVDLLEEGKRTGVELAEGKGLVLPFGKGVAEGFVLVLDPLGLGGYFAIALLNV